PAETAQQERKEGHVMNVDSQMYLTSGAPWREQSVVRFDDTAQIPQTSLNHGVKDVLDACARCRSDRPCALPLVKATYAEAHRSMAATDEKPPDNLCG